MKKRVLVTGSEGFTGRYVCDELAKSGWEVWEAGIGPRNDQIHYLIIDLLKPETLEQISERVEPDVVIHLAAASFVAASDPTIFYKVNLIGTRHLLESLASARVPPSCTILASSANVYGNFQSALSEDDATFPVNDYAISKLAMEHLAKTYMDALSIVITRPFNYTGVGQSERFLIPKIVAHYRATAKIIELGNLDIAREFNDVRDIAYYYRRIAESQPNGETINLCSGKPYSLVDVMGLASDITGSELKVVVNPEYVRENEIMSLCGDRSKLIEILGEHQPLALSDTLSWMLS